MLAELDDFLQELDEDVEGMQSTILFLQQELKLAKETITNLERENYMLKNGNGASGSGNNCACSNNGRNWIYGATIKTLDPEVKFM